MDPKESARNALLYVLDATPGERIAVVCDDVSIEIGRAFAEGALAIGLWSRLFVLETGSEPRASIPTQVREAVASGSADIYITIFRESERETPFRIGIIDLISKHRKYRLGHCPGITMDMLTEGALALSAAEHRELYSDAQRLMSLLSGVDTVRVTSPNGTDASFRALGRDFFTDTRFDWKTYKWGNLPTGEAICAPIEDSLDGIIVCDLSIGGIGRISSPVTITARGGRAERFECADGALLRRVEGALGVDDAARYVGEFAFGLNKKARLTAGFLEAEKVGNTIHFAFGHNTDFPGGRNASATHMDFLVSKPTVAVTTATGKETVVMRGGVLQ